MQRTYTQFNPTCRLMDLVFKVAGGEGDLFPDTDRPAAVRPAATPLETGALDLSALAPALEKMGWTAPDETLG